MGKKNDTIPPCTFTVSLKPYVLFSLRTVDYGLWTIGDLCIPYLT